MARDTLLTVRLVDARSRIAARVEEGQGLLAIQVHSEADFRTLSDKSSIWDRFNVQLLQNLFSDDSEATEYDQDVPVSFGMHETLQHVIQREQTYVEGRILRLRMLFERLEFFQMAASVEKEPPMSQEEPRDSVFIVHGRGHYEHEVWRAISEMRATPIILQEELHEGSASLLEKLERVARRCGYAVVIYSGDDLGASRDADHDPTLRARENVVLELGYFLGLLGRKNVSVLYEPGVAFPSDFSGIGYYELDAPGAWKARIEGELRRAELLPKPSGIWG